MNNYIEIPISKEQYKLLSKKPVAIAATHQLPKILFDLGVFEYYKVNDEIPLLVARASYELIELERGSYVIRIPIDAAQQSTD